jgi:uncharacterized protein
MQGESCLQFPASQGPLIGILGMPTAPTAAVLIVAGQPQTRHGSHRMFTRLGRQLAEYGIATLRFDCGGWGDSPGTALGFEYSAADICHAAQALVKSVPPRTPLVIAGLCDGASAAVLALPELAALGVAPMAICLINPWVRSDATLNDALVQTWYRKRFTDPAAWRRLLSGRISVGNLYEFGVAAYKRLRLRVKPNAENSFTKSRSDAQSGSLPDELLHRLMRFDGQIWTLLSGRDLTAGELESLMDRDARWRRLVDDPSRLLRLAQADHTFSDPDDWATAGRWLADRTATLTACGLNQK